MDGLPPENVIPIHGRKKKKFTPSLRTIGRILREEPELGAGTMFRLNEFSGELLINQRVPRPDVMPRGKHKPREVRDVDITHLIEYLDAYGGGHKISPEMVARAVYAEGDRNKFSSAQAALDRLPPWDQIHRLESFWSKICGAAAHEEGLDELQTFRRARYLAATAKCFFIGLVARILDPGCKMDSIVILEGAQGTFKSTLLRVIAFDEDEWFSDSMTADLKNKDARAHLRGKLIIELAELSQFRSTKIEGLKAFLSAQDDKYRPPYGKGEVTYKRQCTFVGTTNDTDYLVDLTGNRRFWPIRCGEINIALARELMPQLYAEALHWWRARADWHLPKEIELIAEDEQRERLSDDPWEDKARELVEEKRHYAKGMWAWVSTGELLTVVGVSLDKRDRGAEIRAGKLLVKLSGKRMKRPRTDGWPAWGYRFDPNR